MEHYEKRINEILDIRGDIAFLDLPEISYDQLYGWIEHEVKDIKSIIKIK